ncbi:hypothetical protein EIL87_11920 [Saccharopolyspora rhizosphaerae]|uniref:Uncharacterized protein n=1 Tax=Saccharopolyspora rhizosphaerae TaxID=2492662 RepID=A0A426JUY3_9PSEU|nr:hypothetical protein [Saccharopolyspora rhizosphaerae]RRO16980.1 hypothetical protein EIL87_11920 [Saccharopolyspora rhizosphaerae]
MEVSGAAGQAATWWQAVLSLLVGLITAGGAYLGVRHAVRASDRSTRQREWAARREEWRQRFSVAVEHALDDSPPKRAAGLAMLTTLGRSEARADDAELLERTRGAVRLDEGEDTARALVKVRRGELGDETPIP